MRCTEAERLISMRVDGEALTEREDSRLAEHLAACPACREALRIDAERARLLDASLREKKEPAAMAAAIVREALREGGPREGGLRLRFGGGSRLRYLALGMAAAGALALGTGIYLARFRSEPQGPDQPTYVIERNFWDTNVLASKDNQPIGRGTSRSLYRYTLPFPTKDVKGKKAGELILDVERVDTRFVQLANWSYR